MLSPDQKEIFEKVEALKADGSTYNAAVKKLGLSHSRWNYIKAKSRAKPYLERPKKKASPKSGATRKGEKLTKAIGSGAGYMQIAAEAPKKAPQSITIPLSRGGDGPLVLVFGSAEQLAAVIRGAMH